MKWNNVKAIQPGNSRNVLVTDQIKVWIGDYSPAHKKWAVVYDGSPLVKSEDITHWMELPNPIYGYEKS